LELFSVEILCANIILAIAACIHGVLGFGITLLSAPLLFYINPEFVPVPLILSSLVLVIMICARDYSAIEFTLVKWPIVGNYFGAGIAGLALTIVSQRQFQFVFSILVFLAVLLSAVEVKLRVTPVSGLIAGMVSGFMGVTTSIAGPPVALLLHSFPADRLRANLSAFFLLSATLALIVLYLAGYWEMHNSLLFVYTLPGLFTGFFLSRILVKYKVYRNLKWGVLLCCALSSIILFINAWTASL